MKTNQSEGIQVEFVSLAKRVALRFARGFVAGAISTMAAVSVSNVEAWSELYGVLNTLALSAVTGGIAGGLMAADKLIRDKKKE